MSSEADDGSYRKSVRNASALLIVIVVFLLITFAGYPILFPQEVGFPSEVSVPSPYGFNLILKLNATSISHNSSLLITGLINSSSSQIENITAKNEWPVDSSGLWGNQCNPGWPLGIGVMSGNYGVDNYSSGTLMSLQGPYLLCIFQDGVPQYYLLERYSPEAIVNLNGTLRTWDLAVSFAVPKSLQPGVYTALVADEWGDIALTNFAVAP